VAKVIQAVRGMNDVLPQETYIWQYVEATLQQIVASYGYQEIRYPIVEQTHLFKRTIGEVTDIVEKEMYTFEDRNGDSLTLRPEGTAGCVRAGIEHGLFYNQIQRLWYCGPYFRHERPQKGRYRQFHQFGVEVFGLPTPDIDAELILLSARFWKKLGIADAVTLQINSLGTPAVRQRYRQVLVDYFMEHQDALDEDSQRRLQTNPLRILDTKNPDMADIVKNAPKLIDVLDDESRAHFSRVCQLLDEAGLNYEINPCLVRGLDYYAHTVFEWVTDKLGAQGTICAGGRFDGLVKQLGGHDTPAIGFALGLERLIAMLDACDVLPKLENFPHVYFVLVGDQAVDQGLLLAERVRDALPAFRVMMNCGGGSFKSQFKKADKSGALLALVLGEDELKHQMVTVKFLREDKPQASVAQDQLIAFLQTV